MLSVMQVFQIIFSLIAAVLIITFLISYAGDYQNIQGSASKARAINDLLSTANDVYLTGNPTTFDGFQKVDLDYYFDTGPDQDVINSLSAGNYPVYTPLLMSPGKQMILDRVDYDYGWWRFSLVEALPEMKVIFTLEDNRHETRQIVTDILSFMPSTLYHDPPVLFGLCDDNALLNGDFCGSGDTDCHRTYFLTYMNNNIDDTDTFSRCTAALGSKHRLVTLSGYCSPNYVDGLCINTNSKNVYLSGLEFEYRDTVDILALLIGWENTDILDHVQGKMLYDYINRKFIEHAQFASEIQSKRIDLLYADFPSPSTCRTLLSEMKNIMDSITSATDKQEIIKLLADSKSKHKSLVTNGCDYL